MSVSIVREVARRFLTEVTGGVLVVKGAWGVGKTYAWRRLVEEVRGEIKPGAYSYVSLFGLTSIADLRMAILANRRPVETLGQPLTFEAANEHWLSLAGSKASEWWNRVRGVEGGGQLI